MNILKQSGGDWYAERADDTDWNTDPQNIVERMGERELEAHPYGAPATWHMELDRVGAID